MKRFNIGDSDFKNLIENNNYYIDKTLFIEEVINTQKQVLLISRPRRFGKTMNIRMLKYYFQKDKPEYAKLFQGLNIEKAEKDVLDRMGKYPVICLSFKDAKETDYQKSLKKLSKYLYEYHKEKVVILIDEYDTPIQTSYTNGFYQDAISFMRNLLSGAYKDNKYLYKGVLTGILKVSSCSPAINGGVFTGLNNIGVYTILEPNFADKFGFTEEEVKQIVTDLNIPEAFENIKKWYNGYTIGRRTEMYNPWSILNYAVDYETGFKSYWVNTSSDDLLKEKIKDKTNEETRTDILKLINGERRGQIRYPPTTCKVTRPRDPTSNGVIIEIKQIAPKKNRESVKKFNERINKSLHRFSYFLKSRV